MSELEQSYQHYFPSIVENYHRQKKKKNQLYSIHSEFAQHKKIIGKKIPIFAQEYKTAK